MSTTRAPICVQCRYFNKTAPTLTCLAFPHGIPDDILESDVLHIRPVEGDHGVQFEPERGSQLVVDGNKVRGPDGLVWSEED